MRSSCTSSHPAGSNDSLVMVDVEAQFAIFLCELCDLDVSSQLIDLVLEVAVDV